MGEGARARIQRSSWAAGCDGWQGVTPLSLDCSWLNHQPGRQLSVSNSSLCTGTVSGRKTAFCLFLQFKRRGKITNILSVLPESSPFEKINQMFTVKRNLNRSIFPQITWAEGEGGRDRGRVMRLPWWRNYPQRRGRGGSRCLSVGVGQGRGWTG